VGLWTSFHAAVYNVFNIQRHLVCRRTLRLFRDQAMLTWRESAQPVQIVFQLFSEVRHLVRGAPAVGRWTTIKPKCALCVTITV
jgi:hypothetical protein